MAEQDSSIRESELGLPEFHAALYQSRGRLRAIATVLPPDVEQGGIQTREKLCAEPRRASMQWVRYAVTGGIGQLSMAIGTPLSIFASHDQVLRLPSQGEMKSDIKADSSVVGPKLII